MKNGIITLKRSLLTIQKRDIGPSRHTNRIWDEDDILSTIREANLRGVDPQVLFDQQRLLAS